MTKRMLVDATHPEETRVAIVESYRDNNRLEDFDFGLASKPILRGNIYLAKVMRIEPSLQAAFVEYGGNRHGFLPFSEIHPDYFRIPVADRSHEEGMSEDDQDDIQDDQDDMSESGGVDLADYADTAETVRAETAEQQDEPAQNQQEAAESTLEILQPVQALESAEAPAPSNAFPHPMGDEDVSVGLITDFGNAAVDNGALAEGSLTEVAMSAAPPESVGGEVTERIVRQHRPRYKIQEVLKRGQVMLIQVVKEERGNKGAALTTFLSLAGRYCVLMPNTDHGGGVSRKITNHQDRRRMKEILDQLAIPDGMAVILRTAGMEQDPPEIQRDLEYLLCMWDNIREQTLQSSAPALIYEEANLIKRSVRDLYTQDISEILVAGQDGYEKARDFMRAIMTDQADKIRLYEDPIPLFIRYQVENQIDMLHNPTVQLRSGGYLVINPTEALVSIDVNSGRATRERHIEETAVKTNLEAADEIARQLRLRDLAGLVVIDFIDMEDGRNNAAVERRIKEAMKNDRARLQIGRISPFGLLELSRQRLRPSLVEINFEKCPHCTGTGYIRSPDSAALSVLRAIEDEAIRQRSNEITIFVPAVVAIYILNHKRAALGSLESRYGITVVVQHEEMLPPPGYKLERAKTQGRPTGRLSGPAVNSDQVIADTERGLQSYARHDETADDSAIPSESTDSENTGESQPRRQGRGRFRQKDRRPARTGNRDRDPAKPPVAIAEGEGVVEATAQPLLEGQQDPTASASANDQENQRRRRRGRRGGRRRNPEAREGEQPANGNNTGNEPNGNHWAPKPFETEGAASSYAPQTHMPVTPVHIPRSIHELDTTPKPVSETPRHTSTHTHNNAYEIVNPPSEQPKGGWWRRLTGQ